jgi:DNA-3-methyladenine glycosylase I
MKIRCEWVGNNPLHIKYHDEEWGIPVHDDRRLFECLVLGGFQAGLSWLIILRKRESYRNAFDGFDPSKVAEYGEERMEELLRNDGIVRNRLKIQAAVTNAKAFLRVQDGFGSFDQYIWQFVGGSPIQNHWENMEQLPTRTPESDLMSRELKKRGFKFVGSTICYAFMQAVGMVNDHTIACFRYGDLRNASDE